MNSITKLKQDIARHLKNLDGLTGAKIITAFPPIQRDFPLKQPVVVVGVDGVEVTPAGFGGYLGDDGADPLYGDVAHITTRFDLYVPPEAGGDSLHTLYEALCEHLMLRENPFGFQKLWCGETTFDAAAGANRLIARAALRAAIVRREEGVSISSVQLIRIG